MYSNSLATRPSRFKRRRFRIHVGASMGRLQADVSAASPRRGRALNDGRRDVLAQLVQSRRRGGAGRLPGRQAPPLAGLHRPRAGGRCAAKSKSTTSFKRPASRRCVRSQRPTSTIATRLAGSANSPSGGSSTPIAASSAPQKRDAGREVPLGSPSGDTAHAGLIDLLVVSMTTATQAFSRNQRELHLLEALAKLPADQREALRLRYVEGLPSKEIATRLGKSDGAVRVMLTRSLGQLQQLLGPEDRPG